MGTCHHPFGKNISTDTLKTNMSNNQDLRKGGFHHNYNHRHHHHHPYDNNGRYSGGVLVG